MPEAAPLTDRDELDGIDRADLAAVVVDHAARRQVDAAGEERLAAACRRDEADVLAVGFAGRPEAQRRGTGPHLRLGERADRQQDAGQGFLTEHVDDVGLILGPVSAASDAAAAVRQGRDAGVMTGRHRVETEDGGPLEQPVELHMTIALDAWVRCPAGRVIGDVGPDDVRREVVAEVEDVVVDTEVVGDAAGVVHIAHRATSGVALAAPEFHRDADDIVSLVAKQSSRDR